MAEERAIEDPGFEAGRSAPATSDAAFLARVPTRATVLAKRQEEEAGYWFPLRVTGGFARVRVWSIADRAMMARLPQSVQSLLAEELDRSQNGGGRDRPRGKKELAERLAENLEQQEAICNEFCRVGFLLPRVVTDEAQIDPNDPYCVLAGDLHIDERLEYFALVMEGEASAAKKLRPFRAGPVADVPGQPGDEAAATPERVPGSLGAD